MKVRIMLPAILLFLGLAQGTDKMMSVVQAQEAPSWTMKSYYSLEDGNQLYSECQSADKNLTVGEGDAVHLKPSTPYDMVRAGLCWGYIQGVVDSIPAGEGFEPDKNVRISQYVDVVLAYLRDNPGRRHLPAYGLTRSALSHAFPSRVNKIQR